MLPVYFAIGNKVVSSDVSFSFIYLAIVGDFGYDTSAICQIHHHALIATVFTCIDVNIV